MKSLVSTALVILFCFSLGGCGTYVIDPFAENNVVAANRSAKNVMDATTWQMNYAAAQTCPQGYEDAGSRITRNTRIDNDSRLKTGGRNPLIATPQRDYTVDDRVNKRTNCKKIGATR
jgi:hypothetical protein